MEKIDRREAIKRTAAIMGCTLSGTLVSAVLSGCSSDYSPEWSPSGLTLKQTNVAADLAEVILPRTDTPGAKDAHVERFIDSMVASFFPPSEKKLIQSTLESLVQKNFTDLSFDEQSSFTAEFVKDRSRENFFLLFKQMTLMGFFTSEVGATQVLQYDPIPGGYWGCESISDMGGKTWAT